MNVMDTMDLVMDAHCVSMINIKFSCRIILD